MTAKRGLPWSVRSSEGLRLARTNPLNNVFAILVILSAGADETIPFYHLGRGVVLRDDLGKNRFGSGAERLGDK
ncbi:MAG: hypothetical protein HY021_13775 [Burkholderiales bacterium]|nr:hypothetical protein [Burkholderiales bacterium]